MHRWLWSIAVLGLALPPSSQAAGEIAFVGLAEGNRLLRFGGDDPSEAQPLSVSGVSGELLGIDRRPADGALYGVSTSQDLYRIDPESGAATRVSSLTRAFQGTPSSGFDWNPQADRLRLLAETGQNLRVHVDLGAVAIDGPLAFAAGDPHAGEQPLTSGCAYTDNVDQTPVTRLFDIDWRLDALLLQDPPNDGELQTVGALGHDFGPDSGFDILTRPDGSELAYASSGATLYRIDLESGAATPLGAIGDGSLPLIGLTLLP